MYLSFALLLNRCGSSNLSEQKKHLFRIHLGFDKRSSVVVQICPRICFCGESISKNAFRWFESVVGPEMHEMHLQNFEKLWSRKLLVKYSAYAECEIIHFVNCEILLLRRNVK